MSNQRGVTLISLTIYIIALTVIISILATITTFFYKNVNDAQEELLPLTEFTNFNAFFSVDANSESLRIKACHSDDSYSYIIFYNINSLEQIGYVYVKNDKAIYRYDNESKVKIARGVENCTFEEGEKIVNGKSKIKITIKIQDKTEDYSYMINN